MRAADLRQPAAESRADKDASIKSGRSSYRIEAGKAAACPFSFASALASRAPARVLRGRTRHRGRRSNGPDAAQRSAGRRAAPPAPGSRGSGAHACAAKR